MKKNRSTEPTLSEILEGVDIVGTMLDQEIPHVRAELAAIKAAVAGTHREATPLAQAGTMSDVIEALGEIKEILEQQEQRLLKIDARLAQLEAEYSSQDQPGGAKH